MSAVGLALTCALLMVAIILMVRRGLRARPEDELAKALVHELPDAVFMVGDAVEPVAVNARAEVLLKAVGRDALSFLGEAGVGEFGLSVEGRHVDLDVRATEVRTGKDSVRVAVVRDVTTQRNGSRALESTQHRLRTAEETNVRLRRELVEQTLRDTLTGLPNRRHLERRLDQQIDHAAESGEPFAVVIVDVDHLRSVNDLHGRAVGDRLLTAVAAFLGEQLYPDEVLVRFGGEEFAAILPGCDGIDAYHRAQCWVGEAALVGVRTGTVRVSRTLSAGVAAFPAAGTTREQVVAAADSALYRAKQQGRNRVGFTPAGFDSPTAGRRAPRHRAT